MPSFRSFSKLRLNITFFTLPRTLLSSLLFICGCGKSGGDDFRNSSKGTGKLHFTNVTQQSGLGDFIHENGAFGAKWFPEPMGAGGGFIDYNGDGYEDLLLVGGGVLSPEDDLNVRALVLYRNNGDGTFSDVTTEAGLGGLEAYGFGISAADYDNDGDQDFVFTTLTENMFFRNSSGYFTEVGSEIGISSENRLSTAAIFFDADKDGHLDLYIGNYIDWSAETDVWCTFEGNIHTKGYCTPDVYNGVPGRYYHNNADGTFSDKSLETGFLPAPGKTLGVAELDHNKDGWPDLVVANDLERDLLYENNRDGTFTEKGVATGMAYGPSGRARAGMGVDAGIVDRAGEVTIFVGNFQDEMFSVYRYFAEGFFTDFAEISRLGSVSLKVLTFGMFLFDAELDGDLDLFAVNGHIQVDEKGHSTGFEFRQLPQLFLNDGDGVFDLLEGSGESVLKVPIVGRGGAYADYDKDGDLDLLITENNGPVHLWRNNLFNRSSRTKTNYLRVELRGRKSNRDGIGSLIELYTAEKTIPHRIRSGSSYLSQSEKVATFGLSEVASVDSLKVYWPSGIIDTISRPSLNRQLTISEGQTLSN